MIIDLSAFKKNNPQPNIEINSSCDSSLDSGCEFWNHEDIADLYTAGFFQRPIFDWAIFVGWPNDFQI